MVKRGKEGCGQKGLILPPGFGNPKSGFKEKIDGILTIGNC